MEMFVSKLIESLSGKALIWGLVVLLASPGFSQNATPSVPSSAPLPTPMPQAPAPQHNAPHLYSDQDYSRSKSAFPNVFSPYTSRTVPPPNLTNSARTD